MNQAIFYDYDDGTTALIAYINQGKLSLASIGDSKALVINQNGLTQLTVEHNLTR